MEAKPRLTAPALYAAALGRTCEGNDNCHWCGAPCPKMLPHNDPTPPNSINKNQLAKYPGNGYQCIGCWLFAKTRTTVFWLGGGFKDGQAPAKMSWWMTEAGAWCVRFPEDSAALYRAILRPPLRFALSLLDGTSTANRLQLALANDHAEIKASTPLTFTINNTPFCYSIYEMEEALTAPNDLSGTMPGVRELIKLLGPYKPIEQASLEKSKGRPLGSETLPNLNKKIVTTSRGSGFPTLSELKV